MSKNISVGIDIGTYQVKVVVAETRPQDKLPRVIGSGMAESKGLRHGYILNAGDVVRSIKTATAQAEKASGKHIKKAYISIGGIGLQSITHSASVMMSKADLEVTDLDVAKATEVCERDIPKQHIANRKIIHTIPLEYKIDGNHIFGRPQGMKGSKLEVKTLFVTCLEQHVNDIVEAVNDAGIEVLDIVASPIAASLVTVSKSQKIAGCLLANIGAETVSIVVFENMLPISLEVFPIGGTDITNDIALGFRIPIDEAESVKRAGSATTQYPRKKLEEIIIARLGDIFELINAHLKKIGKNGLLPAGIIITGGSSGIATIEDLAKAYLKLPSRIATLSASVREGIKDSTWSVAYGLCILGLSEEEYNLGLAPRGFEPIIAKALGWFRQFLP